MAASFDRMTLSYSGIKSIIVSDEQPDGVGNYVRTLQIYTDDSSVVNRRPVLELRLSDVVAGSLQIETPNLKF